MKKQLFYLLLIPLLLGTIKSHAQDKDSIAIVSQAWEKTILREGITWKKAHFTDLFNSNQVINIVEIDLTKNNLQKLGLEALPQSRKKTSFLADSIKALAAINGGFFDMKNGGAVDFIKVNNKVINTTRAKSARANAYLAFNTQKLLLTADSLQTLAFSNVLLAGPYLVEQYKNSTLTKGAFNDNRHPRTAVAIKNNMLILITADGRNAQAAGLNLHELANLLRWYGCSEAMNLDGGGSTALYISGQPDKGIVNYPSDNKLFDHAGERAVSNIIYIK